jgi:hypothetical protein
MAWLSAHLEPTVGTIIGLVHIDFGNGLFADGVSDGAAGRDQPDTDVLRALRACLKPSRRGIMATSHPGWVDGPSSLSNPDERCKSTLPRRSRPSSPSWAATTRIAMGLSTGRADSNCLSLDTIPRPTITLLWKPQRVVDST